MNTVNAQCTECGKAFMWKDQLVPILCPECRQTQQVWQHAGSKHLAGNVHTHGNVDAEAFLRSIGRWVPPEVTV